MCRLAVSICLFVFFLGCSSPEERFKEIAKHSADKVKELYPDKEWETTVKFQESDTTVPPLKGIITHRTEWMYHSKRFKFTPGALRDQFRSVNIIHTTTVYFEYDDGQWVYKRHKVTVDDEHSKGIPMGEGAAEIFAEFDARMEFHEQ